MTLLEFFQLKENPFSATVDSRFFHKTPQHAEALARLKFATENMKGLAVVVGDIGTGKTTLATRLLEELETGEYEAAMLVVVHAAVTSEWMLRKMALQLEIPTPAENKTDLLIQLAKRLEEVYESGKKTVVIIDEAQMLRSRELMEDFRGLLNIEINGRKVVTFVLFGLTELDHALALDPPLHQRVAELCLQQNLHDEAIQVYLQLGRERSAQQRRDEARDAYLAVLRIDPGNPEAEQFIRMLSEAPPDSQRSAPSDSARGPATTKGQDSPNLLAEAARRMNEGQYAGAEAILTQLLSQEPGNPEVCQLLAKLHLKRGDLAVALNEYRFLAGAAMRAQDYELAESLIGEYLIVDPACVALLELRGEIHEKKGNGEAAAIQYGKALDVLLVHPEPGMPTLPAELYAKIKMLAPASPLVSRFTPVFEPTQPTQSTQAVTDRQVTEHQSQPTQIVPPQPAIKPSLTDAPKEQKRASSATTKTAAESDKPEKPLEQDYETHYTLGVAYKDMGLLEEAIEELSLAAKGTECALDASIMLAACLKDQGTNRAAISCLEQALADPRCKGEKAVSVRYELGILYEAEGRFDRAIRILETIPTFQDVPKRIEWMKTNGQSTHPSSTNPRQGSSEPVAAAASGKSKPAGDQPDRKKRRISYL
ncbi:MAG: tetratricopeptide repeat protein [Nitrospirae bacterium]|nr:MAG: tetratricopeptide repeat protein [Nitrospirota bacterium]